MKRKLTRVEAARKAALIRWSRIPKEKRGEVMGIARLGGIARQKQRKLQNSLSTAHGSEGVDKKGTHGYTGQ